MAESARVGGNGGMDKDEILRLRADEAWEARLKEWSHLTPMEVARLVDNRLTVLDEFFRDHADKGLEGWGRAAQALAEVRPLYFISQGGSFDDPPPPEPEPPPKRKPRKRS